MSKKISSRLTAVAFAAALTLAGTAEAGPLSAGAAGHEESPWSLAWEWLTEAWGDLTGLQQHSDAADSVKPKTSRHHEFRRRLWHRSERRPVLIR